MPQGILLPALAFVAFGVGLALMLSNRWFNEEPIYEHYEPQRRPNPNNARHSSSASPANSTIPYRGERRTSPQNMQEEICFCYDEENTEPAVRLRCSHRFHISCITLWQRMNTRCPICRARIEFVQA